MCTKAANAICIHLLSFKIVLVNFSSGATTTASKRFTPIYLYFYFFKGSDAYKACTSSFIFSLVNPADVGPTKMALKADKKGYGMYCHRDHCPTFGAGHDLHIANAANTNANSYSNVTNTYEGPPNQSGTTFLVGSKNFIVKDFEVFGYQK